MIEIPSATGQFPDRWKAVLYSFIMVVMILAAFELLCRLFPHRDARDTVAGFVIPDRDLIWRLRPFADGDLKTNELGLRDTSFNSNARIKILLLGDSVSWGDSISDVRKCYPYLLEQALNQRTAPGTVEVINSGCPGYSTFQEGKYLELYGLKLKPDLVILQFCLNDVVERYSRVFAYGGDNVFLGVDTRESVKGVLGWLVRHSRATEAICRGMQKIARRNQNYEVSALTRNTLNPQLTAAWTQTLREIEQVREICQKAHVPLLLLIAPYDFQLLLPDIRRQPQDRLIAFARTRQLPCVDLLPALAAAYGPGREKLFTDASHFSEAGHKLAAAELVAPVLRILPLPAAQSPTAAKQN